MNTTPFPAPDPTSSPSPDRTDSIPARDRALVLGGGGSAGNAWLIGVVAGLVEAGIDVTEADLVVGTSAGSTAAAQITSRSPLDLLADIVDAAPPQRTASPSPARPGPGAGPGGRPGPGGTSDYLRRTGEIIAGASDASDMRRRMGAWALELAAASDGSEQTRWRATVAPRLPSPSWPRQLVRITAVDASTGEPAVFDRDSGVELVDAVAASCSSSLAYRIGDRSYIDGGYRRNENADLATGYRRVLVVSPLGGRTRHPLEWGMQLAAQVDELRAGGSRVETVVPDAAALEAFGDNLMNPASRPPAARAGYEQGRALAGRFADFWR